MRKKVEKIPKSPPPKKAEIISKLKKVKKINFKIGGGDIGEGVLGVLGGGTWTKSSLEKNAVINDSHRYWGQKFASVLCPSSLQFIHRIVIFK